MPVHGRIVFHRGSNGLLNLCRKAVAVRATAATIEVGSNCTGMGIPVCTSNVMGQTIWTDHVQIWTACSVPHTTISRSRTRSSILKSPTGPTTAWPKSTGCLPSASLPS